MSKIEKPECSTDLKTLMDLHSECSKSVGCSDVSQHVLVEEIFRLEKDLKNCSEAVALLLEEMVESGINSTGMVYARVFLRILESPVPPQPGAKKPSSQ